MNLNLKHTIKYFIISTILSQPLFAIKIENIYDAVDVAGKQRMYTQRMLKDYAMIGMNNSFGNSKEDLKIIIDKFDEHLHALYDYTKNNEIKKSSKKIELLWLPIKNVLKTSPSKNQVKKLQESLEELLDAANNTTELFAKETGEISGEIVNISGRQRMLSQRMASLYMLKVWGIDDKKFQDKMESTMKLFRDSLDKLKKSEQNTIKIDEQLEEVEKAFKFFEVMNKSSSIFIPSLIYKKSNDILKNMNIVTHSYADESKKGK